MTPPAATSGAAGGQTSAARWIAPLRACWGTLLLVAPATMPGVRATDRIARRVLQMLGLRHILQAAVTGQRPSRARLDRGAEIDALHAATALVVAGLDQRYRRPALLDAAIAASWGTASRRAARRTSHGP